MRLHGVDVDTIGNSADTAGTRAAINESGIRHIRPIYPVITSRARQISAPKAVRIFWAGLGRPVLGWIEEPSLRRQVTRRGTNGRRHANGASVAAEGCRVGGEGCFGAVLAIELAGAALVFARQAIIALGCAD